jgi:simple sugar transport system permease protein
MLLAVGMCLVIASGGIDLSVGSVMALAGVAAALLITRHNASPPAAIAAALVVAAAAGAVNGLLVSALRLQPIIATLITLIAARGLAQTLSDDQKVRFASPAFELLAGGWFLALPVPLFLVAGVGLAAILFLRFTAFGLYLEACGVNPRAARLCGLPVAAIRIAVYTASALCAGLAGLIAAADIKEADVAAAGQYLELDAILAVVIGGASLAGGKPSVAASLIGALVMHTLAVGLQMRGVITEHTLIIKALVILAVCAAQSPGLFRPKGAAP